MTSCPHVGQVSSPFGRIENRNITPLLQSKFLTSFMIIFVYVSSVRVLQDFHISYSRSTRRGCRTIRNCLLCLLAICVFLANIIALFLRIASIMRDRGLCARFLLQSRHRLSIGGYRKPKGSWQMFLLWMLECLAFVERDR